MRGSYDSRRCHRTTAPSRSFHPSNEIALENGNARPDYSPYVRTAREIAASQRLDFLELVAGDGTIVSSAQWPARFGYKEEWVTDPAVDWNLLAPLWTSMASLAPGLTQVDGQGFYDGGNLIVGIA